MKLCYVHMKKCAAVHNRFLPCSFVPFKLLEDSKLVLLQPANYNTLEKLPLGIFQTKDYYSPVVKYKI